MRRNKRLLWHSAKGFSLLEVLIALAVGALLFLAVAQLQSHGLSIALSHDERLRQQLAAYSLVIGGEQWTVDTAGLQRKAGREVAPRMPLLEVRRGDRVMLAYPFWPVEVKR
ncbi:type IV pilus modification PilV family protein [Chrysiogenes arsenatis]|uniref:type IV pilus modification PilV family protein n=1 Tax=Chrysiogenes arsenatis TaxID=309797 RepID=UPI0004152DC9|nr:prepilin-type N-terminal cleavage/methylation domain-containing protein [Chrysiogenes arsenatis]